MVSSVDAKLPWDSFPLQSPRVHIDRWRQVEWKRIEVQLRQNWELRLPDGLEPHWVAPGSAVFWKQDKTIQPVLDKDKGEKDKHNVLEWVSVADKVWRPTTALPVGNASQLRTYIERNGFRLRPPRDEVESASEEMIKAVEAAAPPEEAPKPEYICLRHEFLTHAWEGYLRHCDNRREMPDTAQAPEDIISRAGEFTYYCFPHDFGASNERLIAHHLRQCMTKITVMPHATKDQMMVRRPETASKEK